MKFFFCHSWNLLRFYIVPRALSVGLLQKSRSPDGSRFFQLVFDGRNPINQLTCIISERSIFQQGFIDKEVVQDFFHQPYIWCFPSRISAQEKLLTLLHPCWWAALFKIYFTRALDCKGINGKKHTATHCKDTFCWGETNLVFEQWFTDSPSLKKRTRQWCKMKS